MKNRFHWLGAVGVLLLSAATVHAQINSWTHSGNALWEDAYWSLGILPGTNQTILFTNGGRQTLTIGTNAVQHFADTLTVDSITISAPANSFNTLAVSGTGSQIPLTVRALTVGTNSSMQMTAAGLLLDGPSGVGLQVGGEFEEVNSGVSGQQVNVGYIGPGNYRMIGGMLAVSNLWVSGSLNGTFNQMAGTNSTGVVHLESGGIYNLSGGYLDAAVYFNYDPSTLHQTGGRIDQPLAIFQGTYLFDGGINVGGIVAPVGNGQSYVRGQAWVIQTGGTNFGTLLVGSNGWGNYVLSNGCSFVPSVNLGADGMLHQYGGTQIVTNTLYLAQDVPDYSPRGGGNTSGGVYWLSGGTLTAGSMTDNYLYLQDGGTNLIAGDIVAANPEPVAFAGVQLDGGFLKANDVTFYSGAILQLTGGALVANNLTLLGQWGHAMTHFGPELSCEGGELTVSNIDVEGDYFAISGTTLNQSGTLRLGGMGTLLPSSGSYHFGPLIAGVGKIDLGTNVECQIHFADSSSQDWSNAWLTIDNWSGSIYGGGAQQIFFGSNSAGLTSNQLSHIVFQSPPGMPPHHSDGIPEDLYYARILATGEIVPDTGAPLAPKMAIVSSFTNSGMQLELGGEIGQSYDIEVSTDLVNWSWWTNEFNSNGTIYLNDSGATNFPQRYYRARPAP